MRFASLSLGIAVTIAASLSLGSGSSSGQDASPKRDDILIADFEGPRYAEGWTKTGEAFGDGPAPGTLPNQMHVDGHQGQGLVNSYFGGDKTTGVLTSPDFKIERKHIKFLVGGGRHLGRTGIRLMIDRKPARIMTGHDSEHLLWRSWDVKDLVDKKAQIEIFDQETGGWGHINVDQIVQSDQEPQNADSRQDALKRAEESVATKAAEAARDDQRPIYHVMPPAFWNNDPNGPIHYDGYYHLFYQSNPYGDDWGNMHWGHVRSKDLAHWERQPIALWPSKELGEDHVFSGCAVVVGENQLMLIYTSIGPRLPEQWAAIPEDDSLQRWKKHPANPIMTEDLHGSVKVHEWRDPFLFRGKEKTYAVLGGNLNASKGGQGVVVAYEAENQELTRWKYRGVLFQHPSADVRNVECPLFVPIDDKGRWLLVTSQGRPVHGFIGRLDETHMKFLAESTIPTVMDHGAYYAPNIALDQTSDQKSRRLLWGWVTDFPKGRGWNGCLTLPRVLSLGPDGKLRQQPAPELEALRDQPLAALKDRVMPDGKTNATPGIQGVSIELDIEIDLAQAKEVEVALRRSADGKAGVPISYDVAAKTLKVGERSLPFELTQDDPTLRLRVFLDRSVTEVYVNDRECVTVTAIIPTSADGLALTAKGGEARLKSLDAWPIHTIWADTASSAPAPSR